MSMHKELCSNFLYLYLVGSSLSLVALTITSMLLQDSSTTLTGIILAAVISSICLLFIGNPSNIYLQQELSLYTSLLHYKYTVNDRVNQLVTTHPLVVQFISIRATCNAATASSSVTGSPFLRQACRSLASAVLG